MSENQNTIPATKGRKPNYEVHVVTEENGKTLWSKQGALWKNDNGYMTGNFNDQKIVLQSREAKEALLKMRQQKQEAPVNLSHTDNVTQRI